jgi:hypothetical protein
LFTHAYSPRHWLLVAVALGVAVGSSACSGSADETVKSADDSGAADTNGSDSDEPADTGPGATDTGPGTPADTGPGTTTDTGGGATLDQLAGVWAQDQLPGPVTVEMVGTQMNFKVIPTSTSKTGCYNAMTKGFVSIGGPFIKDIAPSGTKFTANILWKTGTSSSGVTEVAWSPCTMVVNGARSEIAITTSSPFSGSPSTIDATLYKAP